VEALAAETRWTVDDVLKLAPDPSSAGAARRLSLSRVWSQTGSAGSLVWGRCQGSAREPYQVTVDLTGPGFRCSCPSRKEPCKHGLALLMMWAGGEGSVAEADQPADFAADWVQRAAVRDPGPKEPTTPPDPVAQAKRLAERLELMSAGIDDFEQWLFDLVRQGLASARHQPFSFWDNAAARLVDAQLPGLAERVRGLPALLFTGPEWAERLLAELAREFLAVSAWRRRDDLPPEVLADLRVVLGWSRRLDEVRTSGEQISDRWVVAGVREEGTTKSYSDWGWGPRSQAMSRQAKSHGRSDSRLQSQRTWLVGERTGRTAVILDFAAAGATLAVADVAGSVVEADLILYPGTEPRRALFDGERTVVGGGGRLPAGSLAEGLDAFSRRLAANPFADRFPLGLAGVVPVGGDGAFSVVDPEGIAVPMGGETDLMMLLAISGGRPVDLFGEWDGYRYTPLTVAAGGELVSL
jgi:hypothetical protein